MNTATGFILYLIGSFALVFATVVTPALQYYTGAFVIFLFMGGLFYAWFNTIRQTNKMKDANQNDAGTGSPVVAANAQSSPNSLANQENVDKEKRTREEEEGKVPSNPQS